MKSRMAILVGVFFLATHLTACGSGGGGSSGGGDNDPPQQVDTLSPAVISTTPVHNSVAVETNRAITATFNEAIDPATITASTFVVVGDATGSAVTGSVTYDEASRTATFHDGNLSPQATYIATITAAVEDVAGNPMAEDYTWQFTTGDALDTIPPAVLNRYPAPDSISVAPNAVISATFSEPIDPATINAQTLTLSKDGTTPVAGTVTYVGTTVLFKPAVNLLAGAAYTASVAGEIKDLAGNALGTPDFWNFTTGSQVDVDLLGPQVLLVSPPDGALDVPIDSPLVVTFDEAIMPFEYGLIDGRPVAVTFNATYTEITMTPTGGLRPGVTYAASIVEKDVAGNPMDEAFAWKFSTRP